MSKHTPEPWHAGGYEVQCDKGTTICNMSGWKGEGITRANASRIVACVNACAGVDTDLLEAGELDKPIMLVMQENKDIKRRCDELMYALDEISKLPSYRQDECSEMARDAIAKANGGAS